MSRPIAFVHVPKTGGVSFLDMCQMLGIRILDHNTRTPYHISLQTFKQHNPGYFSFAFVRNPWDRVVSSYFYLDKGGDRLEDQQDAEKYLIYNSFREFALSAFQNTEIFSQIHFRPQYQWISDEVGVAVDFVGRFENMQADYNRVLSHLKLPMYQLLHANRSSHKHFSTYYDEETWRAVREAYRKDIELFGYSSPYPG